MDKRTVFTVLAIVGGVLLLFLAAIFIATAILGGSKGSIIPGHGIGVIEVKGVILDAHDTITQLTEMKNDDKVKVIVLRVDSPGGAVGPSQEIYEEVKKLVAKKKVVVSMGSVAASGGYYISAPATRIYANPGTITGSIGVLMKFSNIEGLIGKIGLKAYTMKSGSYKDIGSPTRTMTDADKAILQGVIDSIHSQFVRAVADGRKLPEEKVREFADGRIFSGEQALGLKLVDRLGNLQDAIDEAAKLASIKGEPHLIYPPKKKKLLLDMLVEETVSKLGTAVRDQQRGLSVNYEMDGGF